MTESYKNSIDMTLRNIWLFLIKYTILSAHKKHFQSNRQIRFGVPHAFCRSSIQPLQKISCQFLTVKLYCPLARQLSTATTRIHICSKKIYSQRIIDYTTRWFKKWHFRLNAKNKTAIMFNHQKRDTKKTFIHC